MQRRRTGMALDDIQPSPGGPHLSTDGHYREAERLLELAKDEANIGDDLLGQIEMFGTDQNVNRVADTRVLSNQHYRRAQLQVAMAQAHATLAGTFTE